ncbi:MAG: hypothetical protein HY587_08075 [Candidatus Omnitrophica bacterium]|nr:hypothetical protein [Candidatus Omnitrophota bacterium]
MEYLTFSSQIKKHKLLIFTLRDVKNLFPNEHEKTIKNNLSRWVSKGYCGRLRRDLYEFTEPGSDRDIPDLYVANRLYEPSYVSLETALSFYSIIPEVASAVTSLTTRPTRAFRNKYGSFYFRTCKPEAFLGYHIVSYEGFKVTMAVREKALADFIYYRLRSGLTLNLSEERLDKKILRRLNWKKVLRYGSYFNDKTISTLKQCRGYAQC